MNIKQLRDLIKDLPDDMLVVTSGGDHEYRAYTEAYVVSAGQAAPKRMRRLPTAEEHYYSEWYGQENAGEDEVEVKVLVIA